MARVTIVDVAEAAGVRPSTVSKALNDDRGSPEVRRRVREAADRLGYRPNQRARGLRRSESRSIGVLIPDLANPVFLSFLRGVEATASERGYVVLIADGQRSDAVETAALERFFDQGVDGVLLAGPVADEALRLLVDHGVPVSPTTSPVDRDRARQLERSEAAATRQMAERFLELGHRRFSLVTSPAPKGQLGRRYRRSRVGALSRSLRAAGAELAIAVVDPTHGQDKLAADLRGAVTDDSPTAVICGSHLLAPGLLIALDQARLRVPRDVSLVIYGDSDWARAYRPPLSVICYDTYAAGRDQATLLLDRIAGVDTNPSLVVASQYVERGSTRSASPAAAAGGGRR